MNPAGALGYLTILAECTNKEIRDTVKAARISHSLLSLCISESLLKARTEPVSPKTPTQQRQPLESTARPHLSVGLDRSERVTDPLAQEPDLREALQRATPSPHLLVSTPSKNRGEKQQPQRQPACPR